MRTEGADSSTVMGFSSSEQLPNSTAQLTAIAVVYKACRIPGRTCFVGRFIPEIPFPTPV